MGSDGPGWKEPRAGPALRALPVTPVRSAALESYLIWQPVRAWQPAEWDAGTRTVPASPFCSSRRPSPAFCCVGQEKAPSRSCVPSSTWKMSDMSPFLSQGSRAEAKIVFDSGGQALSLCCWHVRVRLSGRLLADMSCSVPPRSRSSKHVGSHREK